MKINDCYMFVFVRKDLPIEMQMVHALHAMRGICASINDWRIAGWENLPTFSRCREMEDQTPNLVLIGIRSETRLRQVGRELLAAEIYQFQWADPDDSTAGLLSIATVPITKKQKSLLGKYRLWTHSDVAQRRALGISNQEVPGFNSRASEPTLKSEGAD